MGTSSALQKGDPLAQRLHQPRGVGALVVTALIEEVGDGDPFSKGRQMAASVGLTPRQYSSGGKDRRLGISKRGDAYLRTILIHGARSVVAQGNTTVHMALAMMNQDADYDPEFAVY